MSATTETNRGTIKGAEYPLIKIFSSDFEFTIPNYQRPYAWTEKEAGTLFDDLLEFYQEEKHDSYFLGSIVLIKQEDVSDASYAEVIDGQQRLTTLTILLGAIAYRLKEQGSDLFAEVKEYILQPAKVIAGKSAKPRLALRDLDKKFFADTVQSFNFGELKKLEPADLPTEAQRNIRENSLCLLERLDGAFHGDVHNLAEFCFFLMNRCFLVVVSTPSRHSAFRVFSVLNNRGLDLKTSDLIKAKVIGDIDEKKQDEYTQKWENLEVLTTRDGLNELLGHIRLIYLKTRAKKDLFTEYTKKKGTSEEENEDGVLVRIGAEAQKAGENPNEYLMDRVLEPYAKAFSVAKDLKYAASAHTDTVNNLLSWLNRVDNSDWMPSAILFLKQKHTPEDTLWFFRKLERLAACLRLLGTNVNQRVQRYRPVIEELLGNSDGDGRIPSVELTDEEKEELLTVLNGDVYNMTPPRRNYLLLRLDSFLSDGLAEYKRDQGEKKMRLSIEHVLPQTVNDGSEWARLWPDAAVRRQWVHRLANLVVLTSSTNSRAQNKDFQTKRDTYFRGRDGVPSFNLTNQVRDVDSWTPEVVQQRQKKLLGALARGWELK